MKLLTSKAIQGYRDYTKRTIAYGKARKRNHIQANQYVALPDPDQPHGITTGCQMALLI